MTQCNIRSHLRHNVNIEQDKISHHQRQQQQQPAEQPFSHIDGHRPSRNIINYIFQQHKEQETTHKTS